jgi:hypothetical protein
MGPERGDTILAHGLSLSPLWGFPVRNARLPRAYALGYIPAPHPGLKNALLSSQHSAQNDDLG